MKKIEDTSFFCIDFVNCDLSEDGRIDSLVKPFLDYPGYFVKCDMANYGISHRNPSRWRGSLLKNIETLKKMQEWVVDFVDRSIDYIQSNQTEDGETVKWSILKKVNRLGNPFFGSVSDRVTNFVTYELFETLKHLYGGDCWYRIISCSKCNKFFVARTVRTQRFCSDKCRWNYHNKEKRVTGKHTEYMRKYLPDWRKRKSQT
jgi:hypothetical protein